MSEHYLLWQVNYPALQRHLLENCETMYSPCPIKRSDCRKTGPQIGQCTTFEFHDVDVHVSEHWDDETIHLEIVTEDDGLEKRMFRELDGILWGTKSAE